MDIGLTLAIVTIGAVLAGPILAVIMTRWIDASRSRLEHKLGLFRILMRTRRMTLNPDHVGALNLVEVEFSDVEPVMKAWREYYKALNTPVPTDDKVQLDLFLSDTDAKLARLLHAIAKDVGTKIEQLDILQGGYSPQAYADIETEQRQLRQLLIRLLSGQLILPVSMQSGIQSGPYPPFPPSPSGDDNVKS